MKMHEQQISRHKRNLNSCIAILKKLFVAVLLFGNMELTAWGAYESKEVLWEETFASPESLTKFTNSGIHPEWLPNSGPNDGPAIRFSNQKNIKGSKIKIKLDETKVRGLISLEAYIQGINLQQGKKRWHSPKLALTYISGGKKHYPGLAIPYGTTEWGLVKRYYILPDDVSKLYLYAGLELCTGVFSIADIKICRAVEISNEAMQAKYRNHINREAAKIPRGNGNTQYRGVMLGRDLTPEAFSVLKEWNVNLVRYPIAPRGVFKNNVKTQAQYLEMIDSEIKILDQVVEMARKNGIKVVIDVHRGPGSVVSIESSNILTENTSLETLTMAWRKLATHYRNNPVIYGYDLLNEPVASNYIKGKSGSPWEIMVKHLVKAIREIDPNTPIIVEWFLNNNLSDYFLVEDPHIIYSPHFYRPKEYVYQGILGNRIPFTYPGEINGVYYDKEQLRVTLKSCILFQKKHDVKIYVGEFSVLAWAKGADQWLKDVTELFEEYGWDWTYHAFREWTAWSLEYDGDGFRKSKPSADNSRKRVMLDAFRKNKK
ncbi:MAG: cellulase family glycosylhydrolase [Victivallales bacterium]|nr:cellulase family glycosylhydrolase [Victivallales bacterium]